MTFEGGEGSGKSTQIARLAAHLRALGHEVVITREPGGSPGAEAVRHIILSGMAEELGPDWEAVLFAAARAAHVGQLIRPALERGSVRQGEALAVGVDGRFFVDSQNALLQPVMDMADGPADAPGISDARTPPGKRTDAPAPAGVTPVMSPESSSKTPPLSSV